MYFCICGFSCEQTGSGFQTEEILVKQKFRTLVKTPIRFKHNHSALLETTFLCSVSTDLCYYSLILVGSLNLRSAEFKLMLYCYSSQASVRCVFAPEAPARAFLRLSIRPLIKDASVRYCITKLSCVFSIVLYLMSDLKNKSFPKVEFFLLPSISRNQSHFIIIFQH